MSMSNGNWATSSGACARSASDNVIQSPRRKFPRAVRSRACYKSRQTLFKRCMSGGTMSAHSTGLEAFKTRVPHLGRVRQTLFQPITTVTPTTKPWRRRPPFVVGLGDGREVRGTCF